MSRPKQKVSLTMSESEFSRLGADLLEHYLRHFEAAGISTSKIRQCIAAGDPAWAGYYICDAFTDLADLAFAGARDHQDVFRMAGAKGGRANKGKGRASANVLLKSKAEYIQRTGSWVGGLDHLAEKHNLSVSQVSRLLKHSH